VGDLEQLIGVSPEAGREAAHRLQAALAAVEVVEQVRFQAGGCLLQVDVAGRQLQAPQAQVRHQSGQVRQGRGNTRMLEVDQPDVVLVAQDVVRFKCPGARLKRALISIRRINYQDVASNRRLAVLAESSHVWFEIAAGSGGSDVKVGGEGVNGIEL